VLVLSGAKSWSYAWLYSEDSFAREPTPPGFAQAAADGPIGLLLANTLEPLQGFQAEFWNPKITRAYVNPAPPINSSTVFRPNCAFVWDKSGRLLPGGCGALPRWWYVSSQDLTVTFRDQPKTIRPVDRSRSNVLIESGGPPRLLAMARGVDRRTHRITENELSVWSFLDKPGQLRVVFSSVGSAASVELPGGAKSTVVPKTNRVVVQQLAARQQVSKFKYAQTKKQPGIVRVQLIEVREGNGPWRKIN
jgi:hypothetical protein